MASIDLNQVIADSIAVSKEILGKSWKTFEPYATHEFKQFAINGEFLAGLKLSGQIGDEEFKERLEIQRLSLKNVLLTIEGIGLITAQELVNAIIDIVAKALTTALKIIISL